MIEDMFDDFFKEAQEIANKFVNNDVSFLKDCYNCKKNGKCNNNPNMEVSYEFKHYHYCDDFEKVE